MKISKTLFFFLLLLIVFTPIKSQEIQLEQWKFKTGDNPEWAKPDFNDSAWKTITAGTLWEKQDFKNYDGYAWYRTCFMLPLSLKNNSYFKDSLQIYLARIDDADETYLNGRLLGKNGHLIKAGDKSSFEKEAAYNWLRSYTLSVNSSLLFWGKVNTLAIRVFDGGGGGGIYDGIPTVSMRNINDYLVIDNISKTGSPKIDSKVNSFVVLANKSSIYQFSGKLLIEIINTASNTIESKKEYSFDLKQKQNAEFNYQLPLLSDIRYVVKITYTESKTNAIVSSSFHLPYVLTPKVSDMPRINGPKVTAARPGNPFLFKIPVTGKRPIQYSVEHLPEGLKCDVSSGIITGSVQQAGEYSVKLKATNELGEVTRDFKIVIGQKLSLTPPMGWNSWNCWGLSVDEKKMKSTIDILIDKGLADHGWAYVNIDDGWEASERLPNGNITTNEKFGDMKSLSDYAHVNGLKLGIYSSPGTLTCGGYLGSYTYEQKDAQTYAQWGIDYLKYDWCSYGDICKDNTNLDELKKPYLLMEKELQSVKRDIVYSLCQYGMGDVWKWGENVGAQLWRTTGDIEDTWSSLSTIGFQQEASAPFAKPGNWNDPDMLIVGYVGWGPNLHPSRLTVDEQYTHISLWSLLSAPLLLGCDLSRLDDFTLNLLTNDEVIEIDQDPLGSQAIPVVKTKEYQIYVKKLEDGSKAVGLFNLSSKSIDIVAVWDQLGLTGKNKVRDLWRQKDLGSFEYSFSTPVPSHGVMLLKISKEQNDLFSFDVQILIN